MQLLEGTLLGGIDIINLGKTQERLHLAGRIIVAVKSPQDIKVRTIHGCECNCWKAHSWNIH
ncbi:hypothetical protein Ahy_B08g091316 isoform B [Arachis hypogaea]|uniref:Uncharacterized protein n=1 Tax=Arachis hypogaea TaxID=3818 RepID=A0A444Y1X4_ARAHY|nr:hypothetical protein Ahy_B08g091316 isoform B [Arachis hypogaea]